MMRGKLYECKECGRKVIILSKGLCQVCRSKTKPAVRRKPVVARPKKKSHNYSEFYRGCIERLSTLKISEYSGQSIAMPTTCNICHILPKRIYKSVAEEPDNIIFLTAEEHTKYDRFLDCMDLPGLRSSMPGLYDLTIRRVSKMVDQGKIKERGRLIYELETAVQHERKQM